MLMYKQTIMDVPTLLFAIVVLLGAAGTLALLVWGVQAAIKKATAGCSACGGEIVGSRGKRRNY